MFFSCHGLLVIVHQRSWLIAWVAGDLGLLEVTGIVDTVIWVLDLAILGVTVTLVLAALALEIPVKGLVDRIIIVLAHLVALVLVNQEVDLVDHPAGLGLVAQMILGDLVVQIVRVVLEILAQVSLVASVVLVVVSRTIEDLFNLNKYKYKKMHHPYFLVA